MQKQQGGRERENLATLVNDMERWGARATGIVEHRGVRRRVTSYGALATMARRFAAELVRRNVQAGDRLVLWGANSAEWTAVFFGCVLRGVLVVPLDAIGSSAFAAHVVEEVTPRLIVGDHRLVEALARSGQSAVVAASGVMTLETLFDTLPQTTAVEQVPALHADTPLQILFTSGSTGRPKGVVQTHGNLLASLLPIEREIAKYRRYERWVHPLRFLHTLPLSHVFGQFMGLWVPPLLGACVVYESRVSGARLLELLPRERVHVLAAVPRTLGLVQAQMQADQPELAAQVAAAQTEKLQQRWWRFRRVHWRTGLRLWAAVCGGATLPEEVEMFWRTLGFALVQGYGLTETAALVTLNHPFQTARGSLGKPLPGRTIRLSESGELEVQGAMVSTARWQGGQMVPATQPQGEPAWLQTGDLAALEPDGRVRFLGRTGQRLVTPAGLNVYLEDVEQALEKTLGRQGGRREAMVLGVPGTGGATVVGAVIAAPGGEAAVQGAVAHTNAALGTHQRIVRWWLWPELALPRTATGKLRRAEVEAWIQAKMLEPTATDMDGIPYAREDAAIRLLRAAGGSGTDSADAAQLEEAWGLDSMGRVALATSLEEEAGLAAGEDVLAGVHTLGDLRALLGGMPAVGFPAAGHGPAMEQAQIRGQNDARKRSAYTERAARAHGGSVDMQDVRDKRQAAANMRSSRQGEGTAVLYRYPRWPWYFPVAGLRMLFRELLVRPLVAILAGPRVRRDAAVKQATGPMLIISNHRTAMDVPLLLFALPFHLRRRVVVAMSGEMLAGWARSWSLHALPAALAPHRRWWGPVAAIMLRALFHVFPLPKTSGFRRGFAYAGEALDRGASVLIFPEGRRSQDGAMLPFRPGLGMLAMEAAAPVLPVALRIPERTAARWFRSRPGIVVGTPLPPMHASSAKETTQALQTVMQELLARLPNA